MTELEQRQVTAGKITVDPDKIGDELEKIRRQSAALDQQIDIERGLQPAPRMRSTLSNLIILTSSGDDSLSELQLNELLTELSAGYPSRFFMIDCLPDCATDGGKSFPMSTAVSSRCVLAHSGLHVCSEEIYISVGSRHLAAVPNLLLSQLVPDVPTHLLILCDPVRVYAKCNCKKERPDCRTLICGVKDLCESVIYDSKVFRSYNKGVAAVFDEQFCEKNPQKNRITYHDLNWLRIKPWQNLIAGQFDFGSNLFPVDKISTVRISKAVSGSLGSVVNGKLIDPDELLLAGWVTDCLGWSCQKLERKGQGLWQANCVNPLDKTVIIEFDLDCKTAGVDSSFLSRVEILCGELGDDRLALDFSKDLINGCFLVKSSVVGERTHSFSMGELSASQRIVQCATSGAENGSFSRALLASRRLAELFSTFLTS